MSFVKCFDVVEMVTDEATAQLAPRYRENPEAKDILREYCQAIDQIAREFRGEYFEASLDELGNRIQISLGCHAILCSKKHILHELIDRAICFSVIPAEDGLLELELVFPSIWRRVRR